MTKFRKMLAILLCTTIAAGMTACGGGTEESSDSTKEETAEETTEKTTEETEEQTDSSETATLSFQSWNPNDTTIAPAMEAWAALDNGIEVNFECLDYNDYLQDLKIKLAAGEGPDIFGLQDGALMKEFDEYLVDITDLAKEKWGDDWESKFNPLYLQLIKGENEGYKGLPIGGTSSGYFYTNTTALAQYGIEAAPTNYDELKADCDKIRKAGGTTMVSCIEQGWFGIDVFMSIAGDINQEKMYDAIAGEADWTDPELVEAFDIFQKLFSEGICVDGQMGGVDQEQYFAIDQTSPFKMDGAWFYSTLANSDVYKEAIANGANFVPSTMDWNNDGKAAPVTTGPDVVLCINKNSKNLDAAWEYLSFMVTDGVTDMIDNNMAYLPPSTDYVLPEENFDQQAVDVFKFGVEKISDGTAGYREIPYPDLKTAIIEQLQLLGLEETTPEEAAAVIQAASEAQER